MTLWEIFAGNKARISANYVILTVESVLGAFIPYALGMAVDGLLASSDVWFWGLVGICVSYQVVTCFRMMYDTRAFGHIWRKVSVRAIRGMIDSGVDSAKIINRDTLVQRFVDFYELSIPEFVKGAIAVGTSIAMLAVLVGGSAGTVCLLAAATLALGHFFAVLDQRMDVLRAEAYDDKYDAIQRGDRDGVDSGYGQIVRCYIRRSDYRAWRWTSGDVLSLISTVVVIFSLVRAEATAGVIVAAVTYCWKLFESLESVSEFLAEVKEIRTAKDKLAEVNA